jgi:hypothetical protein
MFAPKPMLVVSATGDWTRNVPREEFPAIRKIYDLYGKGDQVEVIQIDQVHNFNQLSREAVYRFFAKHNPGLTDARELTEHDITVPPLQDMLALSDHTLPAGALDLNGVFRLWQDRSREQDSQLHDVPFLRNRLMQTLAVQIPNDVVADVNDLSIVLSRRSNSDRVPGIFIKGSGKTAIVIDPDGSSAALSSPLVRRLQSEGGSILLLDVFQVGAARAPRIGDDSLTSAAPADPADDEAQADTLAGGPKFLTFNVSVDAARVQDIVTAIAYLRSVNLDLYASGDAALWSTFAAALSPTQVSLHLEAMPALNSNADYVRHFNVPGILRAGGLSVAQKLVNSR